MGANTYPDRPILLVEDMENTLADLDTDLKAQGITNTIRCADGNQAPEIAADKAVEVIMLDLGMSGVAGREVLKRIHERHPHIPVIIITGSDDEEIAMDCLMQRSALDYLVKPVKPGLMLPCLNRALEIRQLRRENIRLADGFFSSTPKDPGAFADIITEHSKMLAVFKYCEAIAEGRHPVLITGEAGVGKGMVARALHQVSKRPGQLVTVNVAGLDDRLFAETLFGHGEESGTSQKDGMVEMARGGTLFLDEIGELGPVSQVRLLRLLKTREYFPVGSEQPEISDARILVATRKDLAQMQTDGVMRNDLLHSLRTHHLHIPPLRERLDDIPLLLDHFLDEAAKKLRRKRPVYHQEIIPLLKNYNFPGNVSELRSMVFNAMSGHRARLLRTETFVRAAGDRLGDPTALAHQKVTTNDGDWAQKLDRLPTLKAASLTLVREALRRSGNNQRVAASLLGITPQALNQRLKRQ